MGIQQWTGVCTRKFTRQNCQSTSQNQQAKERPPYYNMYTRIKKLQKNRIYEYSPNTTNTRKEERKQCYGEQESLGPEMNKTNKIIYILKETELYKLI